jgi:hypothetical protein
VAVVVGGVTIHNVLARANVNGDESAHEIIMVVIIGDSGA